MGPRIWNELPQSMRQAVTLDQSKRLLKPFYLEDHTTYKLANLKVQMTVVSIATTCDNITLIHLTNH